MTRYNTPLVTDSTLSINRKALKVIIFIFLARSTVAVGKQRFWQPDQPTDLTGHRGNTTTLIYNYWKLAIVWRWGWSVYQRDSRTWWNLAYCQLSIAGFVVFML